MSSNFFALDKDEEMFESKIKDMFDISLTRNITKFSPFLDERQQIICQYVASKYDNANITYFGGYDDCQRKMLGIFADYDDKTQASFPITALTFKFRNQDSLSHRDFLGALMSLRIKREAVGDILVEEGRAVVFLNSKIADIVLSDVTKIGNIGVKIQLGFENLSVFEQKFHEINGTVSSLRLDCIISMFMNISRDKASDIINSQLVHINSVLCIDRDTIVSENDKISVKGFGKIIIVNVGNLTKKNRIHVNCKKFL
ncbi:MAG: YlmH/Sll1252 family protein [Oscillospiraceae bacterium]